jgi:hypothetical protein
MDLNIDPIVLNGSNYEVWDLDIETLLKSKVLWQYTKVVILDPTDASVKFSIDGKKDEVVGVIMTYISQEIHFHVSGLECPNTV